MFVRWDPQKDYNNLLSIAYFKSLDEFKEISKNQSKFCLAGHRINEDNSKLRKLLMTLK